MDKSKKWFESQFGKIVPGDKEKLVQELHATEMHAHMLRSVIKDIEKYRDREGVFLKTKQAAERGFRL